MHLQEPLDALIIGAGQAGLAAAYHLQRADKSFTILEAGTRPVGSWPHYYDSLHLFSPARFSSLPGLPFPGDPERYPARDEVIANLETYAAHFAFPICFGARVVKVTKVDNLFTVVTADNRIFQAHTLIAATGSFTRPYLPMLPGQQRFQGTLLHSVAYRNPNAFDGQRVVVVGAGNSAIQIATELAQVATVTLATREPVRFVNQRPYDRDIHFWWWLTGFDRFRLDLPVGAWLERLANGKGPRVLDTGVYQAALTASKPEYRPLFAHFTEEGVVWNDGRAEKIDAVIFATGYRPNLAYLEALGALNEEDQVVQKHGVSLAVPGLYFVGLSNQRTFASATLRGVGADAALVMRHLKRYLRTVQRSHQRTYSLTCCLAGSTSGSVQ
jgi:putative flavoprotein involved in K+ transport